ncbi:MAG: carboxypeptidase-like regulatory domain-containing protein, partial [Bacteroidales bacterium]
MSGSQFTWATNGLRPLILLSLGMLWGIHTFGQQAVTGQVIDAQSGQPIGQVNVLAIQDQQGTSTDQEGRFRLVINTFPVTLQFSHIAYQPDSVTLPQDPGKSLQIRMNPRTEAIGEVVVEGGKYQHLMRREEFYVVDYEFDLDKIWVLGYAGKSILNPQLVILTLGVIFTMFFLILTKFAWKPILNMVKQREEMIKGSLASAEKA